jgi:hypothetical protein
MPAVVLAGALVAGCAGHLGDSPSALPHPSSGDRSWLAGVWLGTLDETPAFLYQGRRTFTVIFTSDGSWTALETPAVGTRAAPPCVTVASFWTGRSRVKARRCTTR